MNITVVISSLGCGGAERVAVNLCRGFADRGHKVTLVTTNAKDDFFNVPKNVIRIGLDLAGSRCAKSHFMAKVQLPYRSVVAPFILRRTIVGSMPEVVISLLDRTNIMTLIALLGSGKKIVVTEHVDPAVYDIGVFWKSFRRLTYPLADKLVSVSAGVDACYQWLPASKRAVIHNPIDVDDPSAARGIALTAHNSHIIVGMGRLIHQKGFDLLIQAFARIVDDFPGWNLVILGEGAARAELSALIVELRLSGRVSLPGATRHPAEYLERAELFVLSSRYEGFGNVLVEAMGHGLPVISFDCPSGPNEIIANEKNGLLVPAEDVASLSAAMRRLISQPETRRQLAVQAKATAQRYKTDVIIREWLGFLDSMVKTN